MFLVLKKRTILVLSAIILAALFLVVAVSGENNAAAVFTGARGIRKQPIARVDTKQKTIALTFDADLGEDKTPAIVEILTAASVKATFFVTGFWVEKHTETLKNLSEKSFEIGTHGNTHSHMTKLSREKQKEEIMTSVRQIEDNTSKTVKFFRPPYNEYNDNLMSIAEEIGLKSIGADVISEDFLENEISEIVLKVTKNAKNGSIVQFNTSSDNLEKALPIIITALKNKGFDFSLLSEMVLADNFYIDLFGVQRQKK